ncbi:MAG: hypothetical protein KJ630_05845 [Proteobacteria bacterium]|nr:hypothetical protein [Pseudomonadota bacterium]
MNTKILLAAFGLAVGCALFLWPSNEKKIKANLTKLADYCSTQQEEAVMESLQKALQAVKLCADPSTVQIESLRIDRTFNQPELKDHILLLKKRLPNTTFTFHDTIVNLPGGNKADVTSTLRISGNIASDQIADAYELRILLIKADGAWHFSSLTAVEFLKE